MLAHSLIRRLLFTAPLLMATLALASPPREATPSRTSPQALRGDRVAVSTRATGPAAATAGLAVDPSSVSADVFTGDAATRALGLGNTGGAPLNYRLRVRAAPVAGALRATLAPRLTGGDVLLVEDTLPWGSAADEDLLRAAGATVDRIPATSF